ncbi:tautomerase family protein [Streptomyces brasiliensis]|uniref:Tautomerase enzyme n=1 Tax=Streptomyces brasiliensis TaxID=1954 RepID=A0A917UNA0_9ACTN|nr:tautomerase family protein [Streptomyces brasiliensis]GGJ70127.1 hypothetical protein GCM10010121_095950 [Streptomyces brasiliensis]
MPLVQVDIDRSLAESAGPQISDAIHQALMDGLGMGPTDRFQIFTPHAPGELVFDPGYNGVDRRQLVCIRLQTVHMYPVDTKYALFDAIVDHLGKVSTIVGVSHPSRIAATVELATASVPDELWDAVERLVPPRAGWLN